MRRKKPIESLESRRMLSVSGVALAGPVTTAGDEWKYTSSYVDGTFKVIGPSTFNGVHAADDQNTFYQNGAAVDGGDSYVTLDATKGWVAYGDKTSAVTQIYSPPETLLPAALIAGKTYSSTFTMSGGGGNLTETYSVVLTSETLHAITVPAGKFSAYLIDETTTINSFASVEEVWAVPGIGAVETLEESGVTIPLELASINFKPVTTPTPVAKKLAIGKQPVSGSAGAVLPEFLVDVEDAGGTVVATDTSSVTLEIITGPKGGALAGTVTVKAVKGVATFSNLRLSKAGNYVLKAVDGALTSATSASITIK